MLAALFETFSIPKILHAGSMLHIHHIFWSVNYF